jgi:hypothetical protein
MKKLEILLHCGVFMLTCLGMNFVMAAENSAQICKFTPEQSVSQKRRREAGDVGETTESSRAGRVAFKRKVGRAGRVAFKRKVGRAGRVAFKRKMGRAGRVAFKRKVGRAGRVAFKRKVGRAGRVAFKRKIGRAGRVAFKRKVGRAGRVAFKRKVGRGAEDVIIVKKKEPKEKIKLPILIAPLAPRTTGLTVTEQPTLYWYLSSEWKYEMGFTLNEFGADEPLFEHDINQKTECQQHLQDDFICHINLAEHNVRLQPNREYEWFIFIVFDPEQRTSDWLASAFIRYQQPSKPLLLEQTPATQQYQIYQNEGIWYDGFDQLMRQIKKQPHNQTFLKESADWIKQEQMLNVAEYLQKGCKECYYEIEAE